MSKFSLYFAGLIIGFSYSITGVLMDNVHPHTGISYFIGADGHRITLVHNSSAINPTYDQLLKFIASDTTDQIPYKNGTFTCGDFAERVQNNAEREGIRCGWVSIDLDHGAGHACNVFNTTDKGTVFIDCTGGDAQVEMNTGHWLSPAPLDRSANYSIEPLGILKNYDIYW